jgi:hypothetical protein
MAMAWITAVQDRAEEAQQKQIIGGGGGGDFFLHVPQGGFEF